MSEAFDALIIGAGTVGATAALALARSGREVALIDRKQPVQRPADAPLDPRVVAVSPGSKKLLEAIGAWQRLRHERVAPYSEMRVLAGPGEVRFRAAEHGLGALGWIIELGELDRALGLELAARRRISMFAPAEIETIEIDSDPVALKLADGSTPTGHLLIGADGARSRVRKAAGIGVSAYHYNQQAIVTHLEPSQPNPGIAWQRFTDLGPLALLPLPGGRSSLVWSVHDRQADALMALDDERFLEALAEHCKDSPFGAFIDAGRRHALALVRRQSRPLAAGRVALIGDAARSVHPLAGQGLNLGLADVAALIEALNGWQAGRDPTQRLARYARRRWSDSTLVAGGIHFINESQSLGDAGRLALGAGFTAMRYARPARELFVRRACGLDEVRKAVELLAE